MYCAASFFVLLFGGFLTFADLKPIENSDLKSVSKDEEQVLRETLFDDEDRMKKKKMADGQENCFEDCSEESKEIEGQCPYENKQLCMIFSLSKIANVRVAVSNRESVNRQTKMEDLKNSDAVNDKEDISRNEDTDLSVESWNSTNMHCQAIQDVYIPEVKRNLPAYTCRFKNKTFVLSSERFLQDRRSHLSIKIDEDSFQNAKLSQKDSRSDDRATIPALLILNGASNDYRIEMQKNVSEDERILATQKIGRKSSKDLSDLTWKDSKAM